MGLGLQCMQIMLPKDTLVQCHSGITLEAAFSWSLASTLGRATDRISSAHAQRASLEKGHIPIMQFFSSLLHLIP